MRLGLTGRILIGGGLIAVSSSRSSSCSSIQSFRGIRHDTREQQRAQQAVVAAIRLEKLVLDLETGTRGYVITADRRFLEPYEAARRALPAESARLMTLAPGPLSTELDRLWRSYLVAYSIPLVRETARSTVAARTMVASGEGKRRVDRIRGLIDPFVERENAISVRDQQRVEKSEHSGVVLGVIGSALRLLALRRDHRLPPAFGGGADPAHRGRRPSALPPAGSMSRCRRAARARSASSRGRSTRCRSRSRAISWTSRTRTSISSDSRTCCARCSTRRSTASSSRTPRATCSSRTGRSCASPARWA